MLNKFIHIGLHKTGSTYLQYEIFNNIKNLNYVQNNSLQQFVDKNNKLLISNEALSGIPYKKGTGKYFQQFKTNIKKLKSIFGEFKVLVGFRSPSSIIISFYKQYLQEGGTLSFDEFYNNSKSAIINPEDLKFSKFHSFLEDSFGVDHVFAYDQKDLLEREDFVLEKLENFLGENILQVQDRVRKNRSVPDNLVSILRTLNTVDKKISNFGVSLKNRIFNRFGINPRNLCQQVLPKILPTSGKKNFIELNDELDEDWENLKPLLNNYSN